MNNRTTVVHAMLQTAHKRREGLASALGALRYAIGDVNGVYVANNGTGGVRVNKPEGGEMPVIPAWVKEDVRTNAVNALVSLEFEERTGTTEFQDTWLAGRWDRLIMAAYEGEFDLNANQTKAFTSFIWLLVESTYGEYVKVGEAIGWHHERRHWKEIITPMSVMKAENLYSIAYKESRFLAGEDLAREVSGIWEAPPKPREVKIDSAAFDSEMSSETSSKKELIRIDSNKNVKNVTGVDQSELFDNSRKQEEIAVKTTLNLRALE